MVRQSRMGRRGAGGRTGARHMHSSLTRLEEHRGPPELESRFTEGGRECGDRRPDRERLRRRCLGDHVHRHESGDAVANRLRAGPASDRLGGHTQPLGERPRMPARTSTWETTATSDRGDGDRHLVLVDRRSRSRPSDSRGAAGRRRSNRRPPHSLPQRREEVVRHLARRQRPVAQVDLPDRARSD